MAETDVIKLFKCLADRSRLEILRSLLREDMYVELLAQRLGLTSATVSFHLKKLEEAGMVRAYRDQYYTMYTICREMFRTSLLDLISKRSEQEESQDRREEEYRRKVLDSFFEYGKLKSIPAQRKKERICLEEMVKVFEPGRDYPESEVNELLLAFHEDYCTIRREMIAEKLLERRGTIYRRL